MFLSLVHLRELRCESCNVLLADAGARSFIVDADGNPVTFPDDQPPEELVVHLACPNGHVTELDVPAEIAAEDSLDTPDDAPIGVDAYLMP